LRALGWPVCQALPHAFECFEEEVRIAEPYFAVLALLGKASLLRTHEVAKVRGVVRTMSLVRGVGDIVPGV
jgi:dihydropteroate synthase